MPWTGPKAPPVLPDPIEYDLAVFQDQLKEVAPHHRFASADVDVEDLHRGDLVDERTRFIGREFARIAPTR